MKSAKIKTVIFTLIFITFIQTVIAVSVDVKETPYEEAVELLQTIGILKGYEDNTFRPNNTISRAEFAAIIVRLLNLSEVVEIHNKEMIFDDMAETHWAGGDIHLVYRLGILSGYEDGRFAPSEPITYEQAVKTLVCTLGYKHLALTRGGYPDGYMIVASQNGITRNVAGIVGLPATRGMVAQLVSNALSIDMMEQSGTEENYTANVIRGKTLLSQYLNVQKGKGTLTATSDLSLTAGHLPKEDEVVIAGFTYKIGDTSAKDLLGYNVDFYYKHDSLKNENKLLSVKKDERDDLTIIIKSDDIVSIESIDTRNIVLKYRNNEYKDNHRIDEVQISRKPLVVFNGKRLEYTTIDKKWFDMHSGQFQLYDMTDNGEYDLLIIKQYETYIVDRTFGNRISTKYNKGIIELDANNKNYTFSIVKDGKEILLRDLREWDVLAVEKSKDEELINITVINETVAGKVEELDREGVVINGQYYKISSSFDDVLEIDNDGIFYLDIDRKVAAFDGVRQRGGRYGYLFKMDVPTGLSNDIRFRIYTEDGEIKNFNSRHKILFDDGIIQRSLNAREVAERLIVNNKVDHQLIQYTANLRDEIVSITLAKKEADTNKFSLDYKNTEARYGRWNIPIFDSRYQTNSNTKLFVVPNSFEYEYEYAFSNSYNRYESNASYHIEVYDADDFLSASALVLRIVYDLSELPSFSRLGQELDSSGGRTLSINVVDRLTKTRNDRPDQNPYKIYLNGEDEGYLVVYDEKMNEFVKNLSQGDLIQYTTNDRGEVDNIKKWYSPSTNQFLNYNSDVSAEFAFGNMNAVDAYFGYGKVVNRSTDLLLLDVGSGPKPHRIAARVLIYDQSRGRINTGRTEDIEIDDFIFLRSSRGATKDIIIFKQRN